MARRQKMRKVPIVNKNYVWELEVDDQTHEFKVFVGEEECITYEDGVECKRLKIMDKRQMEGLLQIDCQTRVLDDVTDFQLENGIPYIKLEGRWIMSDTTRADRFHEQVRQYKMQAYGMFGLGLLVFLYLLCEYIFGGFVGRLPLAPFLGAFCFLSGVLRLVQLKRAVEAQGLKFSLRI